MIKFQIRHSFALLMPISSLVASQGQGYALPPTLVPATGVVTQIKEPKKKIAFLTVTLLVALGLVAACAAPAPEVIEKEVVVEKPVVQTVVVEKEKIVEKPVVETVVVEVEIVPSSIPLSLNPSKTILNPGEQEQVVISVISEEWQAAELTWELVSKDLLFPGTLSSLTGPAVVYTAPEEGSGEVTISVRGRTKDGAGSASVSFSIEPRPVVGVVEFWTSPSRLDWDSERAGEFSEVYPDVWVKILSLPSEEAQVSLLTAVAAGEPPDVVLLSWEDAQVFGEKGFLDADAATRIIREIGEDKFHPRSLEALFDLVDKTWMAIPTEYGALGIMISSANKSIAEAWVKFLIETQ